MRFRALLLPLCVAEQVAAAAVYPSRSLSEQKVLKAIKANPFLLPPNTRRVLDARSKESSRGSLLDTPSYVEPPVTKVKDVQESKSKNWPGAVNKKIRYGPYRIPPTSENNLESQLMNVSGIANLLTLGAKKPCSTECVVQSLTAALEYADGSPAVYSNMAWLHHVVLWNVGPEVNDAVCHSGNIDLGGSMGGLMELEPGWGVEHLFEAGNERTDVDFSVPNSTVKTGYHLRSTDELLFNVELMNMEDQEKWVWLTLTYDYLEGPHPEFKDGKVVWMSVGPSRCGANIPNPFGKTNLTDSQQPTMPIFTEYSIPWTAPADGYVMGGNGHLHEGGVSTEIFKNSERICTSYPHYSKGAAEHGGGMGHGKRQLMGSMTNNNTEIGHIEKQGGCNFDTPIRIKKGDIMYITANYDFTKYSGMKNSKGELDEVMGIVGSLVAFDEPLKVNSKMPLA